MKSITLFIAMTAFIFSGNTQSTILKKCVTIDNITQNNVTCGGLGDVTINASGGNGALEYSINGGTFFQAGNTFANLNAGTYNIVVRDASLCTDNSVTIINGALAPTIDSILKNDVTCHSLGDITIAASGGNGALEYSIDGGNTFQAGNSFAGLTPNNYTVYVRDASLCKVNSTVDINAVLVPSIDGVSTNDVSCTELGTIDVTASEGYGTLVYSIDGGAYFQTSNYFSGLTAAVYNIVVKDQNACTDNSTITLAGEMAPIINDITKTNETCSQLGSISINASGGNGALTYSFDGGTTYDNYHSYNDLNAGNFNVVVKDEASCLVDNSVTIENEKITIDTTVTRLNNILNATFSRASYRWLDCNNNYQPISGITDQSYTVKSNGKYAVEITKNDCIDTSGCHQVIISKLNKKEISQSFKLLVNPNNQQVSVLLQSQLEKTQVMVYDVLGNLHSSKTQNQTERIDIDFKSTPGLYFVRVITNSRLMGAKSVIMK